MSPTVCESCGYQLPVIEARNLKLGEWEPLCEQCQRLLEPQTWLPFEPRWAEREFYYWDEEEKRFFPFGDTVEEATKKRDGGGALTTQGGDHGRATGVPMLQKQVFV